jgi:hypothetical protein
MGRKKIPGLVNRKGTWHIDKFIRGRHICESTGTNNPEEAERFLARRMEQIRQAEVYGVRPSRTFRQAAAKYLKEETKASLKRDAGLLRILDPHIGAMPLDRVHMGTLQRYVDERREAGWKKRTINYGLQVVRLILNEAAEEWLDEHALTWLVHAPKIKLLREGDKKEPYPLSWDEQGRLFRELPPYLSQTARFKVNTGFRDQEVCTLLWEREVEVPELDTSVFILPAHRLKNRRD